MTNPILSDPLLTTKQAAKLLSQRPMTLAKWRQRGKGPVYLRLGGKVRYRQSDIVTYIEASRIDPAPFVRELRERVRSILETGVGLEELAQRSSENAQIAPKKLN